MNTDALFALVTSDVRSTAKISERVQYAEQMDRFLLARKLDAVCRTLQMGGVTTQEALQRARKAAQP